jgi:hypothetical protein
MARESSEGEERGLSTRSLTGPNAESAPPQTKAGVDMERGRHSRIPLAVKLAYTALVAVVVPVYVVEYGLANFLWFSDIALLVTVLALWRESRLLASTIAVGTLAFELVWNLDFVVRLITGQYLTGITRYMLNEGEPPEHKSLFVRGPRSSTSCCPRC